MPHVPLTPETRAPSNDYHRLPASEKQLAYARDIAARRKLDLPDDIIADRRAISAWIDAHRPADASGGAFANYPSSRQVAFAERIARIKRRQVPRECFRDKALMSRWIECNR